MAVDEAAEAEAAAPVRVAQDSTPPEYRSGFGGDGVKALQGFVQKGGTLVTFAQAGDLPIQRFGLPLRNVVANLPPKEFWLLARRCVCATTPGIRSATACRPKEWRFSCPEARPTK